ncbi:MAG TPA: AsmA family protein [Candidatus Omnitrophota bacterium]|nr:AsmA family protein [Candidatus Omnitrophota bacterium]HRY85441.1 AsmA family protein [Candidatus Omnitrophota bacterium]
MKTILKLVVGIVVVLVVLVLARNIVVKAAVEGGVKAATGMPLSIKKLDLDFSKTLVDIEDLVVKNPAGFHDTSLVDIPKILVDYRLFSFLKGKAHLENLEFDMKEFTVVKNEKGELNLDRLKALQGTQKAPAEAPKEAKAPAKPIPIQIDVMRLKIGKVVYVDYSGGAPSTKEFNINLDQTFRDITDVNSVVRLIVLKAMMSSGISNLVNFDVQGLQGAMSGVLDHSAQLAAQAASKGLDAFKTVTQDPTAAAGQAGETLKSTAGAITSAASSLKKLNPFAKSES